MPLQCVRICVCRWSIGFPEILVHGHTWIGSMFIQATHTTPCPNMGAHFFSPPKKLRPNLSLTHTKGPSSNFKNTLQGPCVHMDTLCVYVCTLLFVTHQWHYILHRWLEWRLIFFLAARSQFPAPWVILRGFCVSHSLTVFCFFETGSQLM